MSASTPQAAGSDPSMDDILASIRRILSEDEANTSNASDGGVATAERPAAPHPAGASPSNGPPSSGGAVSSSTDVFALDSSMIVDELPALVPEHAEPPAHWPMEAKHHADAEVADVHPPFAPKAPLPEPEPPTNAFAISDFDFNGAQEHHPEPVVGSSDRAATHLVPQRASFVPPPAVALPSDHTPPGQPQHGEPAQPSSLDSPMQDTQTADAPLGLASNSFGGHEQNHGASGPLMSPETAAAASSSVGSLLRKLGAERSSTITRSGPTIEEAIREEMRPMLKLWIDTHLPNIVERLVRAEIERVVTRAVE